MPISAARHHGGISGPCPPQQGLCPAKINMLEATGVQIEAQDSQTGAYRPRIGKQELFFHSFCGFTPDFMKRWGQRPFCLVLT